MTQNATTDPPAAEPDFWALVKRDYLAGDTAAVVAERYGVSVRTIRRMAGQQGWRRCDRTMGGGVHPDWPRPPGRGVYSPRRTIDEVIRQFPELDRVSRVNAEDLDNLLLEPKPETLRHFAFKRAAEEAAMDAPARCLAWMRIVAATDRSGDRIEREDWHFSPADRLRAAFCDTIDGHMDDLRRAEEDDGDGSPGAS